VPLRDIFEALVTEQGPSFEHFMLRPERLLLYFLPVMGRFSAFATATGHGAHLTKQNGLLVA
jgi:hypothetical protein